MGLLTFRNLAVLALLATLPLGAQESTNPVLRRRSLPARVGPDALSGHDRADLRRDWDLYWFGGKLSPEYLDFKNQVASEEVRKWQHLLPTSTGSLRLQSLAPAAASTIPTWVNLGPTSNLVDATWSGIDSGRPVAILPHPTISTSLYLATSGGGIFKCVNADLTAVGDWTWTAITDGLPTSSSGGNVAIGAMAMSPVDSNVLYVGLGDNFDAEGRGFYKSTDGGTTWTAATGLGLATRSHAILPLSSSRLLWGTNDGLKLSNDGGATFASVTGGPATGDAWTLQKLSATELICSTKVSTGAGAIYYSSDAGSTWLASTVTGVTVPVGRITLSAASDGATAYGILEDTTLSSSVIARGILKSTDKGNTWTWMAAPTISGGLFQGTGASMATDGGQGWYNHGLGVDPTNANRLVVGANMALYRSMDGGSTWSQMTHWYGNLHPYAHADFHATAWSNGILFVANDGGLAILKDPWRATVPTTTDDLTFIDNRRNKGLTTHLVYNIGSTNASTPADSKWRVTLGLQDNGTRVRQGSGTALQTSGVFEDWIGGDGFGTVVHPTNGDLMLGSLYYTCIYKSTNGGISQFLAASTGITESNNNSSAPFAPKIALGPISAPDTVYTAVNSLVYKSTDFATTWAAMSMTGFAGSGRIIRNLNASRSSNAVGIATSGGHFQVTYNGGASWADSTDITTGTLNTSYIWFNTENDQIVYGATVAPNATAHHLYKSSNGGVSWTTLDGSATSSNGLPFGIPVHVIQNLPGSANTLFVGTDFGVYQSLDGGSTWTRFGNGLPMVATRDLYIAPNGSFLRAGTYGRGVWEVQLTSLSLAVAPTAATVVYGGTQAFTPAVTGGTANTVTWTASTGTIGAGPTASGSAQTYTAPASGTSATVTATTVETPAATASATVTLVAPSAVTVAVTPVALEMMTGSGTQQFAAAVTPLTNTAVTWSGTGVSGTGLFSAASLVGGTYTVTATSQAATTRTGTATVTLVAPASVTVAVTPATATVLIGATRQFAATVSGLSTANQGTTWSVSGGGSISVSGLFTATTAGSFTVTATNAFSGKTGTAAVTVKSLDLNGDGIVDLRDLLFLAQNCGTANAAADLNGDGIVNDADLSLLLAGL